MYSKQNQKSPSAPAWSPHAHAKLRCALGGVLLRTAENHRSSSQIRRAARGGTDGDGVGRDGHTERASARMAGARARRISPVPSIISQIGVTDYPTVNL